MSVFITGQAAVVGETDKLVVTVPETTSLEDLERLVDHLGRLIGPRFVVIRGAEVTVVPA